MMSVLRVVRDSLLHQQYFNSSGEICDIGSSLFNHELVSREKMPAWMTGHWADETAKVRLVHSYRCFIACHRYAIACS
jgi:hypothetical protein